MEIGSNPEALWRQEWVEGEWRCGEREGKCWEGKGDWRRGEGERGGAEDWGHVGVG